MKKKISTSIDEDNFDMLTNIKRRYKIKTMSEVVNNIFEFFRKNYWNGSELINIETEGGLDD